MDSPLTSRRDVLKFFGAGAVCSLCTGLIPGVAEAANFQFTRPKVIKQGKKLNLLCLNTGERFKGEYSTGTSYSRSALRELNRVMRDYRTGAVKEMDRKIYDHLHAISTLMGDHKEVQIICGYRSKKTNEMLRKRSHGVAERSMHLQGKAVDFRIEGVDMKHLKKAVLAYSRKHHTGGVGGYAQFVHIDTGRCRCWGV